MFARHELGLRGELGLLDRIDANGRRVADQEPLLAMSRSLLKFSKRWLLAENYAASAI